MKLQDATEVKVGENSFWIRPFGAFKAANISGEVMQVVLPILSSVLSVVDLNRNGSVIDTDVQAVLPEIAKGFESLSGDKCEQLLRKLLIKEKNIAVDIDGETKVLDEDIMNEMFCGEIQDMYVLAFYVIKVNYGGFFKKLGSQSGSVAELLKKIKA